MLTLVLAGMMAIDMGGPFNKAAYVFASGAFANDPKSVVAATLMAAVMVGGMIPPLLQRSQQLSSLINSQSKNAVQVSLTGS